MKIRGCAQGADTILTALLGCIRRGSDHGTTFLAQIGQSPFSYAIRDPRETCPDFI